MGRDVTAAEQLEVSRRKAGQRQSWRTPRQGICNGAVLLLGVLQQYLADSWPGREQRGMKDP